jgi:ArsR family transcriptional regulator
MTSTLAAEAALLRALAHPVRLGIMRAIAARPETCACDFAEMFGVAQPTASQHLKVLRDAGLPQPGRVYYSVDPAGLRQARRIVADLQPPALHVPSQGADRGRNVS